MSNESKEYFKNSIFQVFLSVQNEPKVLAMVSQMIVCVIQESEGYYTVWPNLMENLVNLLKSNNSNLSKNVYELICKVIKRYHIEQRSDELFAEIINTLNTLCPTMTDDAEKILNYLISNQSANDQNIYLKILKKIFGIFYSLNFQDFPEFFEDNLERWMNIIERSLRLNMTQNNTDLINLKTKVLKCLNFYFTNYYEDFEKYTKGFFPIIWDLMCSIQNTKEYYKMTKELLDFFKVNFMYKRIENCTENDFKNIINKLILPTIEMSNQEYEEFMENELDFIKSELEEVDLDSNKYYAINLLKTFVQIQPNMIESMLIPLITSLIQQYESNRNNNWNKKITAINLLFAIYIKTFANRSIYFI